MRFSAWSSPKPPTTTVPSSLIPSEPWPWSSEFANNSENTVGGWADFSSAAFVANFATFNDTALKKDGGENLMSKSEDDSAKKIDGADSFSKDSGKLKQQNVVENDLKVENVECQTDVSKAVSEKGVDNVAQTDGTQSHASENVKSASGDQDDESSIKAGNNKIGAAEIVAEPSR